MRTKQEIIRAIAILRMKGERLSLIMADTLCSGLTEQQVFQKYVRETSTEERDENVFYAARDAARYVAGHLELIDLVPDIDNWPVEELPDITIPDAPKDYIVIPKDAFHTLMQTIKRLEEKVDTLCGKESKRITYQQTPDFEKDDLMIQEDAFRYIGCSKATVNSWTKKGLIKGYRKGANVFYSKSELDANPVIQNFRNLKR